MKKNNQVRKENEMLQLYIYGTFVKVNLKSKECLFFAVNCTF